MLLAQSGVDPADVPAEDDDWLMAAVGAPPVAFHAAFRPADALSLKVEATRFLRLLTA